MASFMGAAGESGDLFGGMPIPRQDRATERRRAPALTTARVLCRQLRHKQARPEKQRIAHLICLNLMSMLKDDSQRAHAARSR